MARSRSPYKSEKRSKELLRQKKKEAKLLKRLGRNKPVTDAVEPESGETASGKLKTG